MGLILGIIVIVLTVLATLITLFANGMSDAPSQAGISVAPILIVGFGLAALLIVTHYVPIHW